MSTQGDTVLSRYAPLLIALLGALVFAGCLVNGFTFDDPHIVVENPAVTGERGWISVVSSHYWSGEKPTGALYRPLTLATYRLNRIVLGEGPFGYHLVNILLHGLAAGLVYLLGRRLAGEPAATLAALLFATHPIHTEAVVSVVGRGELLAAIFALAAWLLRDRPWTSALLFLGAMFSKENAVILPGLLLAEDLMTQRPVAAGAARWRVYGPHAAALIVFLAARFLVVGPLAGDPSGPFAAADASTRILTAIATLGRGLFLMLLPLRLSADYSYDQIPQVHSATDPAFLLGLSALIACGAAGAFAQSRGARAVSLGIVVCFVALLPVSNLLFGIGVIMAERLYYLPSVGFCLAAGGAIAWLARSVSARRAFATACLLTLVIAGVYAARAARRTGDWFDQLTLFEATVAASPRSALAQMNLGGVYQALGRHEESEEAFRRAIAIAPHFPAPHNHLGKLLLGQQRIPETIEQNRDPARLKPDDWSPLFSLAMALMARGDHTEGLEVLARAVSLGAPSNRDAHGGQSAEAAGAPR